MRFKWPRTKLAPKIFLLTFVMVESVILILGMVYYRGVSKFLLEHQTQYALQVEKNSEQYLSLDLKTVQSFLLSVGNDFRLQYNTYPELDKWLSDNLIYYIPNTTNITILENMKVLASTSAYSWFLQNDPQFQEQAKKVEDFNTVYWLGPYHSSVSGYTLTAAIKMKTVQDSTVLVCLDLDIAQLYSSAFPDKSAAVQGDLLILDSGGQPVFGHPPFISYDVYQNKYVFQNGLNSGLFTKPWTQKELPGSNKLSSVLIRSQNNPLGWQIVLALDNNVLLAPIHATVEITWLMAIFSLLLSIIISITVSLYISRPITWIASLMNKVNLQNLDLFVQLKRKDELGLLADHFNRMASRIRYLVLELTRTEETKKQLEFRTLQSQIRPHFLYNTLNAIGMSAKQGKLEEVDVLITSLTNQLQYSLDFQPTNVTLREEMVAINSYINLMNIRYNNKFCLDTEIDPITLECELPKFTLQPLIENSLFHGLAPKSGVGTVMIGTRVHENGWEIFLEDDGIGIEDPTLSNIRNQLNSHVLPESQDSTTGIGLRNVHHRLQLMFDKAYRMQIDSVPSKGTGIRIELPFQRREELASCIK